jgi:hypothetical protein
MRAIVQGTLNLFADLIEGLSRAFGVRRATLLAALAAIYSAAVLFVFWAVFIFDGRPYRMILKSSHGHATVQFINPDWETHTEQLPVDLALDRTWSREITGGDLDIPGVAIGPSDFTMLPGMVKMRVGSVEFDINPLSYTVNGRKCSWISGRTNATPP